MENGRKWQVVLQNRGERNLNAKYLQKDMTLKSGLKSHIRVTVNDKFYCTVFTPVVAPLLVAAPPVFGTLKHVMPWPHFHFLHLNTNEKLTWLILVVTPYLPDFPPKFWLKFVIWLFFIGTLPLKNWSANWCYNYKINLNKFNKFNIIHYIVRHPMDHQWLIYK